MVTELHMNFLYLCIPIMRREGYKCTDIERQIVSGIHSDLRFTKYGSKPVIIELQSTGQIKTAHMVEGHLNITLDLRNYSMDSKLKDIIGQLKDDIISQIEVANRNDPIKLKQKEYRKKQYNQSKEYYKKLRDEYKLKQKKQREWEQC